MHTVSFTPRPTTVFRRLFLRCDLMAFRGRGDGAQVVRTVVFSSARKDTDKDSSRMQMFTHMRDKTNFEVHMATTMGVQEKCIDIALAVEMMHYATIPDTYDVGGEQKIKKGGEWGNWEEREESEETGGGAECTRNAKPKTFPSNSSWAS